MATDGGNTNDATARRRRIAEKGSDRLALITSGRPLSTSQSSTTSHSSNASCPPSLARFNDQEENKAETSVFRKSESAKGEASERSSSSSNKSKHEASSKNRICLYKTMNPNQLRPAILASQDTRRKCSFFAGIVALLSYAGFPIVGNYIIRSIILWRPLVLLLLINITITVGPLLTDAMKMSTKAANDVDLPENMGSPIEWGMLFITGLKAFFMDSCIYSVVVVCGMCFLQKLGF